MHHPLGPVLYCVPARRLATARLIAAIVLGGCVTVLWLAVRVEPNPAGLGTHQQFGLPPCSLVVLVGIPCPTCGMTTAFAHTVRGELWSAFNAHPGGFVFALATVLALSISLSVLVTGKVWAINWYRVAPARLTLTIVLVLVGGWVYKLAAGLISGALPTAG